VINANFNCNACRLTALAGGLAGVVSWTGNHFFQSALPASSSGPLWCCVAVHPLDVIKSRIQVGSCSRQPPAASRSNATEAPSAFLAMRLGLSLEADAPQLPSVDRSERPLLVTVLIARTRTRTAAAATTATCLSLRLESDSKKKASSSLPKKDLVRVSFALFSSCSFNTNNKRMLCFSCFVVSYWLFLLHF
jgi:hypothetical protein